MGLFTRFDHSDIERAAPRVETARQLRESTEPRDKALWLALMSLERIAGADSPEGNSPEVDALRNLNRIKILLDQAPGA